MHRSGTSAHSVLASVACARSLLDDPRWAVTDWETSLSSQFLSEALREYEAAKVPRFAPFSSRLLEQFPGLKIVWCLREPKAVFRSVMRRWSHFPRTSMVMFPEIGITDIDPIQAFSRAYTHYMAELQKVAKIYNERIFVSNYSDFASDKVGTIEKIVEFAGWSLKYDISKLKDTQLGPTRHVVGDLSNEAELLVKLFEDNCSDLVTAHSHALLLSRPT